MTTLDEETFYTKKQIAESEHVVLDNKTIKINDILGLRIDDFRKFHKQNFDLGKTLTVVFGRNGTLKTSLMGLLAHPFRTEFKDVYGHQMQTILKEILKLSLTKDQDSYSYHIRMKIDDGLLLEEPIDMYKEFKKDSSTPEQVPVRFRIVPSGRNAGDGFFNLPSVYSKLDRIFPLTNFGDNIAENSIAYTDSEKKDIAVFFEKIISKADYKSIQEYDASLGKLTKYPIGPKDSEYDVNSISSGEDNLGTFINTMISFQRIYESNEETGRKNSLTGIWSIDEFEASLHPVAQNNLLDFIISWANKFNVKVVINTHSLSLIQHCYALQKSNQRDFINLNLISSAFTRETNLDIIKNPRYEDAYRELTLKTHEDIMVNSKVTLFCEDKQAKDLVRKIFRTTKYSKYIDWQVQTSPLNVGTSNVLLQKLCQDFPLVLTKVNGIVILDADVKVPKKSNYGQVLTIPSLFNFPIEKEIVEWIRQLPGDNSFFKEMNITRDQFINEFTTLNILEVNDLNQQKTSKYKLWFSQNTTRNKKIITKYVHANESIFTEFRDNLIKFINEFLKTNGINIP